MKNSPFTLSPSALMRLLRFQKSHDSQIEALEKTGADLDAWRLDLLQPVLDWMGTPADNTEAEPSYCRDDFREQFYELGASQEEMRSFLENVVAQNRLWFRTHPEAPPPFPSLDCALKELLRLNFEWEQLRGSLERAGLSFGSQTALHEFDLLPLVLDELDVSGGGNEFCRTAHHERYREMVKTGSEEEWQGFIDWARANRTRPNYRGDVFGDQGADTFLHQDAGALLSLPR